MDGEGTKNTEKTEKIKNLVQLVKETETPGRHAEGFYYSRAAYTAFREISALRNEGFSMAAICRVMEKDGLLPEPASLNSFRRAFRMEAARRNKAAQIPRDDAKGKGNTKQAPAAPVRVDPKPAVPIAEGTEKRTGDVNAERLRQLTGSTTQTGSGVIKKLPNGEFEF